MLQTSFLTWQMIVLPFLPVPVEGELLIPACLHVDLGNGPQGGTGREEESVSCCALDHHRQNGDNTIAVLCSYYVQFITWSNYLEQNKISGAANVLYFLLSCSCSSIPDCKAAIPLGRTPEGYCNVNSNNQRGRKELTRCKLGVK